MSMWDFPTEKQYVQLKFNDSGTQGVGVFVETKNNLIVSKSTWDALIEKYLKEVNDHFNKIFFVDQEELDIVSDRYTARINEQLHLLKEKGLLRIADVSGVDTHEIDDYYGDFVRVFTNDDCTVFNPLRQLQGVSVSVVH